MRGLTFVLFSQLQCFPLCPSFCGCPNFRVPQFCAVPPQLRGAQHKIWGTLKISGASCRTLCHQLQIRVGAYVSAVEVLKSRSQYHTRFQQQKRHDSVTGCRYQVQTQCCLRLFVIPHHQRSSQASEPWIHGYVVNSAITLRQKGTYSHCWIRN